MKTKKKSASIFISYRRIGGIDTARNIHDRLSNLGFDVFMDLTSMRRGKFNSQIYEEIEQANNFILVLSKNSLDRCSEEGDWVRLEVEHAIKHNKNIILVSKTDFDGFPANLPEPLSDIRLIDLTPISEDYYEAFFQHLTERLIYTSPKDKEKVHKNLEERRLADYIKREKKENKGKRKDNIRKPFFSYSTAPSIIDSSASLSKRDKVLVWVDIFICLFLFIIYLRCNYGPRSFQASMIIAMGFYLRILTSILFSFKDYRSVFSSIGTYLLCLLVTPRYHHFPFPFQLRTLHIPITDFEEAIINIFVNGWIFVLPLLFVLIALLRHNLVKRDNTIKQLFLSPISFPYFKQLVLSI